jgi:antitoxin component YwqK of YwqJK toxin-antitoxin module
VFRSLVKVSFAVALLAFLCCKEPQILNSAPSHHRIASYPDGTIHSEYDLDDAGFIHGTMIEYHRNGQIASVSEFEHGIAVGVSEHYDVDGVPVP